jgi:hypothetical protein
MIKMVADLAERRDAERHGRFLVIYSVMRELKKNVGILDNEMLTVPRQNRRWIPVRENRYTAFP